MKTIVNLIKDCLNSPHRIRGRICMFCFLVIILGIFYTINNFINKPINTEFKIEKIK